jgi:Leucine-rich repeat (LRR) protein
MAEILIELTHEGNPLGEDFLQDACYNLIYLELAACRLSILPEGMAKLLPNLRVLNLNYNFLEDIRPLGGLRRLRKLTIIGSRLKSTKPLIRLVAEMPDAEMLDFRYVDVIWIWKVYAMEFPALCWLICFRLSNLFF